MERDQDQKPFSAIERLVLGTEFVGILAVQGAASASRYVDTCVETVENMDGTNPMLFPMPQLLMARQHLRRRAIASVANIQAEER